MLKSDGFKRSVCVISPNLILKNWSNIAQVAINLNYRYLLGVGTTGRSKFGHFHYFAIGFYNKCYDTSRDWWLEKLKLRWDTIAYSGVILRSVVFVFSTRAAVTDGWKRITVLLSVYRAMGSWRRPIYRHVAVERNQISMMTNAVMCLHVGTAFVIVWNHGPECIHVGRKLVLLCRS